MGTLNPTHSLTHSLTWIYFTHREPSVSVSSFYCRKHYQYFTKRINEGALDFPGVDFTGYCDLG